MSAGRRVAARGPDDGGAGEACLDLLQPLGGCVGSRVCAGSDMWGALYGCVTFPTPGFGLCLLELLWVVTQFSCC